MRRAFNATTTGTMKRHTYILVLLLLPVLMLAQDAAKYNWKTNVKIGDDLFARNSYYNAIEHYEQALEDNPKLVDAAYHNAEAHRAIRNYYAAEQWYQAAINLDTEKHPKAYFYLGLMQKMNGKPDEAILSFANFEARKDAEYLMTQRSMFERRGCELQKSMLTNADMKVTHLTSGINGVYPNFAPFPISPQEIIFSSIYVDTVIVIEDTANFYEEESLCRLYTANINSTNRFDLPRKLPEHINGKMHTANGTFSPDRSLFFYTQCATNDSLENVCSIYVSRYYGEWEPPTKIGPQVNKPGSSNTQPTVYEDEEGNMKLIYSSNRDDGKGGMDLWAAPFDPASLSFGSAVNLSELNTLQDEVTPFYDPFKSTLYFSSNGHVNIGGLDVFGSRLEGDKWSEPQNVGKPINTSVDDLYYVMYKDQQTAFIASNRPGTYSLLSETTSEDIYMIKTTKKVKYYGFSYELGDSNLMPLTGVTYKLYRKNTDLGLYEEVEDFKPVIRDGKFEIPLKAGENYKITASKEKYLADTKYITNDDILKGDETEKLYFKLDKISKDKTYTLDNIYYDYNSATLRDSSTIVLDTLYVLLQENPNIIIELSSHTDSRGSDDYNLELSQARAQSCVDYLIEKGIAAERLEPKGYGEEKLLNDCDDGKNCKEELHQVNRRTEFRVTGELEEGVKIN